MASSMTIAYPELGNIKKIVCTWAADTTTGDTCTGNTVPIFGRLIKAVTNPGTPAPKDNYDIAVTDADGVNVLTACGKTLANRDTATSEEVYFFVKQATGSSGETSEHPTVAGVLTIAVTNASCTSTAANVGVLTIYYAPY